MSKIVHVHKWYFHSWLHSSVHTRLHPHATRVAIKEFNTCNSPRMKMVIFAPLLPGKLGTHRRSSPFMDCFILYNVALLWMQSLIVLMNWKLTVILRSVSSIAGPLLLVIKATSLRKSPIQFTDVSCRVHWIVTSLPSKTHVEKITSPSLHGLTENDGLPKIKIMPMKHLQQ